MHNLALALHEKGFEVTGSDDEIFEPSRSRLAASEILPGKTGWDAGRITKDLDTVILGMHARMDNPELVRALELGISVRSFPEFLYEHAKDKKRIVIGGSHGKTTITSLVMHVLKILNVPFDYMVGSQIGGFETMVGLSDEAEIAVFEGDEYLTSALDARPKFHLYKPHIALISGIAWDHMNVFPTYNSYLQQFREFVDLIDVGGILIYFSEDKELETLVKSSGRLLDYIPYRTHPYEIRKGMSFLDTGDARISVPLIGRHNMQNINAARMVCHTLGIPDEQFYMAIQTFPGSGKRLQLLASSDHTSVYLDFAHAPSKVRASTEALKEQFPDRSLVTVQELHTYSSLNADFLPQYRGTLDTADTAIVYFNPQTIKHKKLPPITVSQVNKAFNRKDLEVFDSVDPLITRLRQQDWVGSNLLIMTSGNFDGQDLEKLARDITSSS